METIGNLIDKLITTNQRIWALEDIKRDSTLDKEIADATRKTNVLNKQRHDLIQEIDEMVNDAITTGEPTKLYNQGDMKLYGKYNR